MASNPTGKPSTDSTASLVQAIYFDHSDYIPRSSLPPLPAGWHGPWEAQTLNGRTWDLIGDDTYILTDIHKDEALFLAALLNITHPAKESK